MHPGIRPSAPPCAIWGDDYGKELPVSAWQNCLNARIPLMALVAKGLSWCKRMHYMAGCMGLVVARDSGF